MNNKNQGEILFDFIKSMVAESNTHDEFMQVEGSDELKIFAEKIALSLGKLQELQDLAEHLEISTIIECAKLSPSEFVVVDLDDFPWS